MVSTHPIDIAATAVAPVAIAPAEIAPVAAVPAETVLLQVSPVAVAGTFGSLAIFLSITAFLAARNVLGDVSFLKGFGVGPWPALVAIVSQAFEITPAIAIPVALVADAVAIYYLYGDRDPRVSAYVTLIHVVVSILLGVVVFGILTIAMTAPG